MLFVVIAVAGMVLAIGYIFYSTAEDAPESALPKETGHDAV